jgi:hypothetical protein
MTTVRQSSPTEEADLPALRAKASKCPVQVWQLSVTVVAVGLDLGEAKWAEVADLLAPYSRSYVFAREKGEKQGNFHLQGYCEIRASS